MPELTVLLTEEGAYVLKIVSESKRGVYLDHMYRNYKISKYVRRLPNSFHERHGHLYVLNDAGALALAAYQKEHHA